MLGTIPSQIFAVAVVWLGLGFRSDLATSLWQFVASIRIVMAAVLGIAVLRAALVLARPEGLEISRLWPLAAVGMVGP